MEELRPPSRKPAGDPEQPEPATTVGRVVRHVGNLYGRALTRRRVSAQLGAYDGFMGIEQDGEELRWRGVLLVPYRKGFRIGTERRP